MPCKFCTQLLPPILYCSGEYLYQNLTYFQNEVCNRIISLNSYMEAMNLAIGYASCVGSIFGMYLLTGIEDHPFAFFITSAITIASSIVIFGLCVVYFKHIKCSSRTTDYPILSDVSRYHTRIKVWHSFCNQKSIQKLFNINFKI